MSIYKYSYNTNSSAAYLDLKLYYCGTEKCCPGHCWGPGIKDHFKIHYVHSGKGIFHTEDKIYNITEGQAFLIWPGAVSYYKADFEDPWNYSWVAFNGLQAETLMKQANLTRANPVLEVKKTELFTKNIEEMLEASKNIYGRDAKLIGCLYSLLGLLIESAHNDGAQTALVNSKDNYLRHALEFIETNYSQQISITDIAKHVGISRTYLSKIFSASMKDSPQAFLIKLRMEKACELMKNSSLSIMEISYSVGYQDPLVFSRIFKKLFGNSPKYYRKLEVSQ